MNNADRTALDFLISHALNKIISWDELRESLSDELFQSEEMADVLLEIQNKQIDVIDFQQNIRTTETDKYIFITMELYKFKDCIPEIRKQENGKYLADYLEGKTLSSISTDYGIDKAIAIKYIRTFCKYLSCDVLESKYLPLFIKYEISISEAMLLLHLDMSVYRFLSLKSKILPESEYKKYKSIDSSFINIVEKLKEKTK